MKAEFLYSAALEETPDNNLQGGPRLAATLQSNSDQGNKPVLSFAILEVNKVTFSRLLL
jgi:hypothetical protein